MLLKRKRIEELEDQVTLLKRHVTELENRLNRVGYQVMGLDALPLKKWLYLQADSNPLFKRVEALEKKYPTLVVVNRKKK